MKTVITSEDKSFLRLNEIIAYKSLIKHLSLRDLKVRYKQTWLGFSWSIIRPLVNIIIFGALSLLINKETSITQNFITVSSVVIFWQLISTVITDVSNSLVSNSNILTKVYFPKIILPISSVTISLVDFFIAFILFLIPTIVLIGLPTWQIILIPFIIGYALFFSISIGLFFATASVKFRDVKFLLPFILQIAFYAIPVFIPTSKFLSLNIPDVFKTIYFLNPFVGIINLFKYCLFGVYDGPNTTYLLINALTILLLSILSIRYFLKFEKSFADYI
jgi:lipopolysaccharide transport system permease protein